MTTTFEAHHTTPFPATRFPAAPLPASAFHVALAAPTRSPDIAETDDAYGWLVGSWHLDVLRYWNTDVRARGIQGEVQAGWVLEGHAVQDVWIMPRRGDRNDHLDKKLNMYGSTLRAWDASIRAWRITWDNPAGEHFERQIGRRVGDDIVQLGTRPDGTPTRWRFIDITPDSFHWLGEALATNGQTWNCEGEFLASRTGYDAGSNS
jgi:hypothetical protein